jgi:hypothetical protein
MGKRKAANQLFEDGQPAHAGVKNANLYRMLADAPLALVFSHA